MTFVEAYEALVRGEELDYAPHSGVPHRLRLSPSSSEHFFVAVAGDGVRGLDWLHHEAGRISRLPAVGSDPVKAKPRLRLVRGVKQ